MISLLPPPATYGAAVLTGAIDAAGLQRRGVVVFKASYDLLADGAAPLKPVLTAGKAAHALRLADAGGPITQGGKVIGFALTAETDLALHKTRTDIVVEGFMQGSAGGAVRIDGTLWLARAANVAPVGDVTRHLFGWHPRSEPQRAPDPPDLPAFGPLANNFYRRSAGFSAPGNAGPLPPGGTVAIHRTADATDPPYRFTLPAERFRARLRTQCGPCPDTPTRWRIAESFALSPDTLIVVPEQNRATLLWRGSWDWDRHPTDSLRAVEILREET